MVHLPRETRERIDRFKADALRPLPVIPYDHRDRVEALVHKDLRLHFDGNRYCVPHRYVGRRLTLKADSSSVTIYDRVNEIVSYPRCWRRGQSLGLSARHQYDLFRRFADCRKVGARIRRRIQGAKLTPRLPSGSPRLCLRCSTNPAKRMPMFVSRRRRVPTAKACPDSRATYLWDTSANFGVIWGYPNHLEIEPSNRFYAMNTVKLNGGMQYFETTDPGLAELGHAVFFFTTGVPERIYLDDSDVGPALPLSWCSAEFASAVLAWSRPRVENPGRAYVHRR
jgi:hypothetical protein